MAKKTINLKQINGTGDDTLIVKKVKQVEFATNATNAQNTQIVQYASEQDRINNITLEQRLTRLEF